MSKSITLYTFLLVFKIVKNLKCIYKVLEFLRLIFDKIFLIKKHVFDTVTDTLFYFMQIAYKRCASKKKKKKEGDMYIGCP